MKILTATPVPAPRDDDFCSSVHGEICYPPWTCLHRSRKAADVVATEHTSASAPVMDDNGQGGRDRLDHRPGSGRLHGQPRRKLLGRSVRPNNLDDIGRDLIAQSAQVADDHPLGTIRRPLRPRRGTLVLRRGGRVISRPCIGCGDVIPSGSLCADCRPVTARSAPAPAAMTQPGTDSPSEPGDCSHGARAAALSTISRPTTRQRRGTQGNGQADQAARHSGPLRFVQPRSRCRPRHRSNQGITPSTDHRDPRPKARVRYTRRDQISRRSLMRTFVQAPGEQ